MAQSLIGIAVFFISIRLVILTSGTSAIGLWSLVIGTIAFARLPDISGGGSLSRLVALAVDNPKRQATIIDTVTTLIIVYYSIVIAVGYLPFSFLLSEMVDQEYRDLGASLVPLALTLLILTVISTSQNSALDGLMLSEQRSFVMILGALICIICSVILIPRYGVTGLAISQIIQNLFCAIMARRLLLLRIPQLRFYPIFFSRCELREAVSYGIKIQAFSVPQIIYEPLTRIMINHFADLNFLAFYDLAYKICSYTRMLIVAATTPLLPQFTRLRTTDQTEGEKLYLRSFKLVSWGTAFVFSIACIGAPVASYFLFREISYSFVISVGFLAPAWSLAGFGMVPKLYAQALSQMRWSIIGEWSIALLIMPLGAITSIILSPTWIALGASFAIATGQGIVLLGNVKSNSVSNSTRKWPLVLPSLSLLLCSALLITFGAYGLYN